MGKDHDKQTRRGKKGAAKVFKTVNLVVANEYKDWQQTIQEILRKCEFNEKKEVVTDYKALIKNSGFEKKQLQKAFAFATYVQVRYFKVPINLLGCL